MLPLIYAGRAITGLAIGGASLIVRKSFPRKRNTCVTQADATKPFILPKPHHRVFVED